MCVEWRGLAPRPCHCQLPLVRSVHSIPSSSDISTGLSHAALPPNAARAPPGFDLSGEIPGGSYGVNLLHTTGSLSVSWSQMDALDAHNFCGISHDQFVLCWPSINCFTCLVQLPPITHPPRSRGVYIWSTIGGVYDLRRCYCEDLHQVKRE